MVVDCGRSKDLIFFIFVNMSFSYCSVDSKLGPTGENLVSPPLRIQHTRYTYSTASRAHYLQELFDIYRVCLSAFGPFLSRPTIFEVVHGPTSKRVRKLDKGGRRTCHCLKEGPLIVKTGYGLIPLPNK